MVCYTPVAVKNVYTAVKGLSELLQSSRDMRLIRVERLGLLYRRRRTVHRDDLVNEPYAARQRGFPLLHGLRPAERLSCGEPAHLYISWRLSRGRDRCTSLELISPLGMDFATRYLA